MLFNSPLSTQKADQLIGLLNVSPNDRVLDAGCGSGEFLIRVVEQTGARGLGVDIQPSFITLAREAASARVPDSLLEWRESALAEVSLKEQSFDLAICIGSTHAFGKGDTAYPNAIHELSRLVRPGGQLLIGEAYWKQLPAPEYLKVLGDPVGVYHDHATNISFAEERGLRAVYAITSSEDEWDHFEWSYQRELMQRRRQTPDDPALDETLKRSRAWRDGYLGWGRATMGFGFYLFQR